MGNGLLPSIVQRGPTSLDGLVTDSQPVISLTWNNDISTVCFSDPTQLISNVSLTEISTGVNVPLVYLGYDAPTKTITLQPLYGLDRNTTYRVVVSRLIQDSFGRKSPDSYLFQFTTDPGIFSTPSLTSPSNFVTCTDFPTLEWTASSSGTINYLVQVDLDPYFSSPVYQSVTTDQSITPYGSFPYQDTYYWRVQAYTASASSNWSPTNAFFFGTVDEADQSSSVTYAAVNSFEITDTGFRNGETFLSSFPPIWFTFSSELLSNYSNYIQITKIMQLPRNDQTASYLYKNVTGSWSLAGNTITFTPSETMTNNMRYDIVISKDLAGVNGISLLDDQKYNFSSMYAPFYVHPRAIRARLGMGVTPEHLPDDLLNYMIYEVSLDAQARYYGFLSLPVQGQFLGDMLKETIVRDSAKLNSYGLLRWVEANVVYNIIKLIHMECLSRVGLTRTLEGYQEGLNIDFIKSIEFALKMAGEEITKWDDYLIPADLPLWGNPGVQYNMSQARLGDASLMGPIANRGAPLHWSRANPYGG